MKSVEQLNKESIQELFAEFSKLKVLITGDVMLDDYLIGDVTRISPEAPVPVVNIKSRYARLGGAANVALNVKSLGATPVLCSVIGNDRKSDAFMEILAQEEMTDMGMIRSENRILTTKYRAIGNNTQLLRLDDEVTHPLSKTDEDSFLTQLEHIIHSQNIDVIIFEDYDKGVITPNIIDSIVSLAQKKSIFVLVDPKKRNFHDYKNIDLFKPNWKELREGLQLKNTTWQDKDIAEQIHQFMLEKQHKQLLLTLSGEGVVLYQCVDNKLFHKHIPSCLRNIADVSGAGDTVISVAALCMAKGMAVEDVAKLSNLAGGLVCEEVGVVAINKDKLLQEAINTFI
jgi:rfaE bifunctional protein kinase chain/domain